MFRTKAELSASMAEQVLDTIDEALLVFDKRDRVRLCNLPFATIWQRDRDSTLGASLDEVLAWIEGRCLSMEPIQALERHLADSSTGGTIDLVLHDETFLELSMQPLTSRLAVRGRVWRFSNRTAEKRSEEALLHAQKLESLGVLAGGVAHDFNNMLSSIMGHSELGLLEIDESSEAAASLRAIAKAAERASDLTQQLLAYAGKGTVLVEPVDLSQLVEEVVELIGVSVVPEIEILPELSRELPPIIADATQVRQIAMNLLLNAAEAIESTGTIRVVTGVRSIGEAEIAASVYDTSTTSPGDFVFLRVTDDGSGMDEGTLARIFDPFYSTKFTGRGLGLAAVLGIVRGHRGLLEVESRPRGGTTFAVHLPRGYAPDQPGRDS